ncbi:Spo0E family sporulation regulatory protein-aspartic acid phosphatase [Bacillus sp. DJP31]|uniref:Spo0E family sporulation regulatory protein-aspartic acid phosphatase n=1 Tax=Bacillus sp. DJP31 TaxID=3409789 RepID=UPI003BB7F3EB
MDVDKLIQEIEKQREEMTLLGINRGLTNCDTVKSSQKLDQLLNLLQFSTSKSKLYN